MTNTILTSTALSTPHNSDAHKLKSEPQNRLTVKNFALKYSDMISESGLRWLLFQRETNGMNEFNVVEKIGSKKLVICEENFFTWLEAMNGKGQAHA